MSFFTFFIYRQNDESVVVYPKQEVPKIDKVNKLYPAMADAVTFKYEEKRGNANFSVIAFLKFWKSVTASTLYQMF